MIEQFTPGPWSILFNDKTKVVLEKSGVAIFVADTYAGFTKSDSEQEANAALIAAAPEMYEALKKLKVCIEDYFGKTEREFLKCCDKDVDVFFIQPYMAACNALKKARWEE